MVVEVMTVKVGVVVKSARFSLDVASVDQNTLSFSHKVCGGCGARFGSAERFHIHGKSVYKNTAFPDRKH
ncbi:MAG: hypothetical protein KGJ89_04670 [Patescibacteria group bacterium]|nr:hypothetical protein [Patescibacteria group bacterium]MDE2015585.1 hypothetical protein [Patescibacteria group bacterium]MDE2227219.1 hypothetical protein [Patescibacteria group bacterium]